MNATTRMERQFIARDKNLVTIIESTTVDPSVQPIRKSRSGPYEKGNIRRDDRPSQPALQETTPLRGRTRSLDSKRYRNSGEAVTQSDDRPIRKKRSDPEGYRGRNRSSSARTKYRRQDDSQPWDSAPKQGWPRKSSKDHKSSYRDKEPLPSPKVTSSAVVITPPVDQWAAVDGIIAASSTARPSPPVISPPAVSQGVTNILSPVGQGTPVRIRIPPVPPPTHGMMGRYRIPRGTSIAREDWTAGDYGSWWHQSSNHLLVVWSGQRLTQRTCVPPMDILYRFLQRGIEDITVAWEVRKGQHKTETTGSHGRVQLRIFNNEGEQRAAIYQRFPEGPARQRRVAFLALVGISGWTQWPEWDNLVTTISGYMLRGGGILAAYEGTD